MVSLNHGSSVPHETQCSEHRDSCGNRGESGGNGSDLAGEFVDERRLVSSADIELFDARTEQSTRAPDLQLALMSFRIDHPHAAGGDGNVVDVGTGRTPARIAPRAIVQHLDVVAGELVELGANGALATGTLGPNAGAGRLIGECQDQLAELRVPRPDLLFAPLRPPLVLPLRRRTRGVLHWLDDGDCSGWRQFAGRYCVGAGETVHHASSLVPRGAGADGQRSRAVDAGVWSPELHNLHP